MTDIKPVKKKKKKETPSNELSFKIQGIKEMDYDELLKALDNSKKSVESLNGILYSEATVKFKVKPFKEGSFEWIFTLMSEPGAMFAASNVINTHAGKLVDSFLEVMDFLKFSKGKEVKNIATKGSKMKVQNAEGDIKTYKESTVTSVDNSHSANAMVFNNCIVNFNQIEGSTGMSIADGSGKKKVTASQSDLAGMQKYLTKGTEKDENETPKKQSIYKDRITVNVSKPDLVNDTKWTIILEGRREQVKIKDKNFLKAVKKNTIPFYNQTKLLIKLKIDQEWNKTMECYVDKAYEIEHVYEPIQPTNRQQKLVPARAKKKK